VNLARTLLLICFVTRRATRSLDPVAPRVTPAAAPRVIPAAAPAVPPTASDTSTTPLVRKRAADAATLKAERAKRQKAAADARQVQPNAPPPSSIDLDAHAPIPTAEPLLIDPSGVAHSDVPTADLAEEQHTPPVASPARVTVAVPAPATRSVEPSATATDQATYVVPPVVIRPDAVVIPPTSTALVHQPVASPLSRVDRFRQLYSGLADPSSVGASADPTAPVLESEDQTPAHLQRQLQRLASDIEAFASAATRQAISSEQSFLVSFLSQWGHASAPTGCSPRGSG
jgi:hypothetical protein